METPFDVPLTLREKELIETLEPLLKKYGHHGFEVRFLGEENGRLASTVTFIYLKDKPQ